MITVDGISIPTLPNLALHQAAHLPPTPAVYFCVTYNHPNTQLLYIGITKNLHQRWNNGHHKLTQLLGFHNVLIHWLPIELDDVSPQTERQFIDYWEPLLNGKTHKPQEFLDPRLKQMLPSLIHDPEFSGEVAKVLWGFVVFINFDNFTLISLSDLAKILNLQRTAVSRAVKKLEAMGVLTRGEKVGNSFQFRLNPNYCWKGDIPTLKLLLSK